MTTMLVGTNLMTRLVGTNLMTDDDDEASWDKSAARGSSSVLLRSAVRGLHIRPGIFRVSGFSRDFDHKLPTKIKKNAI
jgi:hypothetical protein